MHNEDIKKIREAILDKNLGAALRQIKELAKDNEAIILDEKLHDIEDSYKLMLDYMRRGFNDPQRDIVYDSLLRRLFIFLGDAEVRLKIKESPALSEAYHRICLSAFNAGNIRDTLENFVSDMALLSLDMPSVQKEKGRELFARHQNYVSNLFDHIIISGQWTEDDRRFYASLLLSPTIDNNDVLILVSAVMLSTMNVFDANKLCTLMDVYISATNRKLRQRALVGWALSIQSDSLDFFPDCKRQALDLCNDSETVNQLIELQLQIMYCKNADRDNEEIQRDIMPNLIKNNNLNITRFGIQEKEENPMDDILNPGAADKSMEQLEESFHKMMEMQEAGSDIYFGGFSQMKKFAFFYRLSNWFCPFYLEHPDISMIVDKMKESKFLQNLMESGPFCDSDKYSFALAMVKVIDSLPENMKSVLDNQDALGPTIPAEQKNTQAYARRMYLQDLYRFSRLCQQRDDFANPFGDEVGEGLFLNQRFFAHTGVKKYITQIGSYLLKNHRYGLLSSLLDTYFPNESPDFWMLQGYCNLYFNLYTAAYANFEKVLKSDSDNEMALRGMARTAFMMEDYDDAEDLFKRLRDLRPSKRYYQLYYCLSLMKTDQIEDALGELYKLNYERPDDADVDRALAWSLLLSGKSEQAYSKYEKLLSIPNPLDDDYLNAGYCQWILGKIENALSLFRKYKDLIAKKKNVLIDKDDINYHFTNDIDVLHAHGISDIDVMLMEDMLV